MTEHLDASKSEFLALVAASCPPWLKLDAPLRANAPEKVSASTPLVPVSRPNDPVMFGPNITGSFTLWKVYLNDGRAEATGAFQKIAESAVYASGSENGTPYKGFTFDASRVSATYGASTVVQPASLCLLPCIKF